MAIERERRFLVKDLAAMFLAAIDRERIDQFYLSPKPAIRVRYSHRSKNYILTSKRRISKDSSNEIEVSLTEAQATPLIENTVGWVEKMRLTLPDGWIVDVFLEENKGLVIAEYELAENELFDTVHRPEWLGREITGVRKYSNSQLAIKPFKEWKR